MQVSGCEQITKAPNTEYDGCVEYDMNVNMMELQTPGIQRHRDRGRPHWHVTEHAWTPLGLGQLLHAIMNHALHAISICAQPFPHVELAAKARLPVSRWAIPQKRSLSLGWSELQQVDLSGPMHAC
jgi:hypothetical protein